MVEIVDPVEIVEEMPYNDQVQGEEQVTPLTDESYIKGGATTIGDQQHTSAADNLVKSSTDEKDGEVFNEPPGLMPPADFSPDISKQTKKKYSSNV
jgi:hypothetical protein